jgi:hypothetical protein
MAGNIKKEQQKSAQQRTDKRLKAAAKYAKKVSDRAKEEEKHI